MTILVVPGARWWWDTHPCRYNSCSKIAASAYRTPAPSTSSQTKPDSSEDCRPTSARRRSLGTPHLSAFHSAATSIYKNFPSQRTVNLWQGKENHVLTDIMKFHERMIEVHTWEEELGHSEMRRCCRRYARPPPSCSSTDWAPSLLSPDCTKAE